MGAGGVGVVARGVDEGDENEKDRGEEKREKETGKEKGGEEEVTLLLVKTRRRIGNGAPFFFTRRITPLRG